MFPGLPFGTMDAWGVIAISGLLHFAYWVFFTKALENGDLSLVYPIMRASPAPVFYFRCRFKRTGQPQRFGRDSIDRDGIAGGEKKIALAGP